MTKRDRRILIFNLPFYITYLGLFLIGITSLTVGNNFNMANTAAYIIFTFYGLICCGAYEYWNIVCPLILISERGLKSFLKNAKYHYRCHYKKAMILYGLYPVIFILYLIYLIKFA